MGVLTAPLAGAYFLGFLGVIRTCRKSPMISSRKVYIIQCYQTQRRPSQVLGGALVKLLPATALYLQRKGGLRGKQRLR